MAVSIDVCNLALGEIRGDFITSIDDNTPEARACARFYPMCLKSLMEMHDWGFASAIVTLAPLATNDRSGEWTYAYAVPADLGKARRVLYPTTVVTSYCYSPFHHRDDWPQIDFIVEKGTLYTSLDAALLEYTRNDLDDADMPAMFKKALSLDLASYLATYIRDDSRLKGELIQAAEVAEARAMADDINRQPNRQEEGFNEVAWVRA